MLIECNTAIVPVQSQPVVDIQAQERLVEETSRIKNEYEERLAEMKKMFEEEQTSKEHLKDEMKRLKAEYDHKLSSVESQYPAHVNLVSTCTLYFILIQCYYDPGTLSVLDNSISSKLSVLPRSPVRIISY